MRHLIRTATLAALLLAAIPAAQAAVHNYRFDGTLDSGAYIGQSFSGSFSFDDQGLLGVDSEYLSVSSLNMSFLGNSFTLADANFAEVDFNNGVFTGLAYDAGTTANGFTLIAGYDDISQAYLAYAVEKGDSGAGSINYAPVPEPESYALLLAGLGLMATVARRRAKAARS